jgi:prevent-host-death family protein
MKVSVAEAKNTLSKLIKAVEDGESVAIYRRGTPVVDIVRTTKADAEKPKFGRWPLTRAAHPRYGHVHLGAQRSRHRERLRPRAGHFETSVSAQIRNRAAVRRRTPPLQ